MDLELLNKNDQQIYLYNLQNQFNQDICCDKKGVGQGLHDQTTPQACKWIEPQQGYTTWNIFVVEMKKDIYNIKYVNKCYTGTGEHNATTPTTF